MAYSLQLGAFPSQILSGYRSKISFVLNVGSNVCYVSDANGVTVENGLPLYPDFAISWDKDIPMWGISDGETTLVIQGLNYGQIARFH